MWIGAVKFVLVVTDYEVRKIKNIDRFLLCARLVTYKYYKTSVYDLIDNVSWST